MLIDTMQYEAVVAHFKLYLVRIYPMTCTQKPVSASEEANRMSMCVVFCNMWRETLKEIKCLEYLVVDGEKILKCVFKKQGDMGWTWFA